MREALEEKAQAYKDIVKVGRTHLMDATPITLGQEFSGWAYQVEMAEERIHSTLPRIYRIAQGGTAVGTGLNTYVGFDVNVAKYLSEYTNLPFETNKNKFEGIAAHDAMAEIASQQSTIATSLMKIANDIRLLGSGPTGGLGEIILPSNEPGSSIMPGKVNPTQAEALAMVAAQVMGNSMAVHVSNSHGHLDLNAFKPIIIDNVIKSNNLITAAVKSFTDHCIVGIEPNLPRIKEHLNKNLMLVTALNTHIGYEKAAKIAKLALAEHITLREAAVDVFGFITNDEYDKILVPSDMVSPKN